MRKILFVVLLFSVSSLVFCDEGGATPIAYSFTGKITSTYRYGIETNINLLAGTTFAGELLYDNDNRGITHISFTFDNSMHNSFDSLVSPLYGGRVWNIGFGFVAGVPDDVIPGAINELYMSPYQDDGMFMDSIYDLTGTMRMDFRRFVDNSLGELYVDMRLTTASCIPVPESGTMLLFSAGLIGFFVTRRSDLLTS